MLKVNEIFYSIQGEGQRAGTANIFIRLAGCDLTCGFCDTEFESYKEMTREELLQALKEYPCKNIIWTGGEPTLQLNYDTLYYFKQIGYYQAVETNGNNTPSTLFNYIVVSPKVAEHVIKKNFEFIPVNELRYARHKGQAIPKPFINADYKYISPIFSGNQLDKENIIHCINLIKENPEWRLSIQIHKLLNIL